MWYLHIHFSEHEKLRHAQQAKAHIYIKNRTEALYSCNSPIPTVQLEIFYSGSIGDHLRRPLHDL